MAEINIPIKAEIQELLDKLNLVKKDIVLYNSFLDNPSKEYL